MKRMYISFLIFTGYASVVASAYLVHEEPVEISIPVSTLQTINSESKYHQPEEFRKPLSITQQPRYLQSIRSSLINSVNDLQYENIKKRFQMQLKQQGLYQQQLKRDFIERIIEHNRDMQKKIYEEDKRTNHRFFRDPFHFNILSDSVIKSNGIFSDHGGHGDGHIYQYYNPGKPLHFGKPREIKQQDKNHSLSTQSSLPVSSKKISLTSNNTSTITSSVKPVHVYEVDEIVDETSNPFAWPNWFGIINSTPQTHQSDHGKIEKNIRSKLMNVKFEELPLSNKISLKEKNILKSKHAVHKKNINKHKLKVIGKEIENNVSSNPSGRRNVYDVKVFIAEQI